MGNKTSIGILGLGGVGGWLAATLVEKYDKSADVSIKLITRPTTHKLILEKGLKLVLDNEEIIVRPVEVFSEPEKVAKLDFLICCTKSYDLETSLTNINACISKETIIISLLNGVDNADRIKAVFPQNEVINGCIYIVSRLLEPAVVKMSGNTHSLWFGIDTNKKSSVLAEIMKNAGVQAESIENIIDKVWEKYIFISALASMTSYMNTDIAGLISNKSSLELLESLINEVSTLAVSLDVQVPVDIRKRVLDKIKSLPPETTSSMYNDFQKGGQTEIESLTGFVIRKSKEMNLDAPDYRMVYSELLKRSTGLK